MKASLRIIFRTCSPLQNIPLRALYFTFTLHSLMLFKSKGGKEHIHSQLKEAIHEVKEYMHLLFNFRLIAHFPLLWQKQAVFALTRGLL